MIPSKTHEATADFGHLACQAALWYLLIPPVFVSQDEEPAVVNTLRSHCSLRRRKKVTRSLLLLGDQVGPSEGRVTPESLRLSEPSGFIIMKRQSDLRHRCHAIRVPSGEYEGE